MRMNLIVLAATAALTLAGASTASQAATSSSACNVFANPWPSMESEDGSPPAISMPSASCNMTQPAAAPTAIKHTGQTVPAKAVGTKVSTHS